MKHLAKIVYCIPLVLLCCGYAENKSNDEPAETPVTSIVNERGTTLLKRFNAPQGYERQAVNSSSFAHYLRNLPLKPAGSKVKYYNGALKNDAAYVAVVNMPISDRNLQQCADAVMRLRAEYFYAQKEYDKISFRLTNDFEADYANWMQGNRVAVKGNKTNWCKARQPSNTYQDFRNYLEFVFIYAGTLSLSKQLHPQNMKNLAIGDVFILGGSPGHAVIVVDVARNKNGEKVFMLAQSYMPAQETQILRNPSDAFISPWYRTEIQNKLLTPEWTFKIDELKTW